MNKWVLVTGGTRGIGRGIVDAFSSDGYDVVFTYQRSAETAAAMASTAKSGTTISGHFCDSSDESSVSAFSKTMLDSRGAPYAIINNVGITKDAALISMQIDQWKEVINTNLNSAFFMIRHFVQAMIEQGDGVILQMSSVSGIKGNVGQTNYSATKAALIGLTRSLALELARFNVRVNAIAPGYIATEMLQQIPETQQASIRKNIPLRRLGSVEEVAALTRFLASKGGAYITGQTFVIDGGLTA